jgi:hypothetical protein
LRFDRPRLLGLVEHELDWGEDHRKRGFQFVRDVGEELRLEAIQLPQSLKRFREFRRSARLFGARVELPPREPIPYNSRRNRDHRREAQEIEIVEE